MKFVVFVIRYIKNKLIMGLIKFTKCYVYFIYEQIKVLFVI